jgi:hypothetical protein
MLRQAEIAAALGRTPFKRVAGDIYRAALENGENPIYERNPNGTQSNKLADLSGLKTAILQVGYERNKAGYKFTEIDDAFPLFKVAQQIWKAEIGDNKPGFTKRDFPIVLSPAKPAPTVDETPKTTPAPERGTKPHVPKKAAA